MLTLADLLPALAVNFAIVVGLMLFLWLGALRLGDVSFIDAFWAFGMVILAWTASAMTGAAPGPHALVILLLVSLWGMRLGIHLLHRWRRSGPDPRYQRILGGAMERTGWSFGRASLQLVFLLQGPLLFLVCLPAQLGVMVQSPAPLGPIALVGIGVALVGIAFETIGDAQLAAFRADPANRGRVLDTGLWRWTRHPNYFGDATTWWGIWLVAISAGAGLWTVICPLFLTWLLMRWSGVPMLEKGLAKTRPGYADYIARTSAFVPWPPKQSRRA